MIKNITRLILITLFAYFVFDYSVAIDIEQFYKDLKNEVLKRHSLSSASPYSVQSLKLVATLLAPKFSNLETLRKQNKIPKNYFKSLALIELPGSEDHVVVYEGQKIGPRSAIIKKITKDKVFLVENNKQIIMEIVQ